MIADLRLLVIERSWLNGLFQAAKVRFGRIGDLLIFRPQNRALMGTINQYTS